MEEAAGFRKTKVRATLTFSSKTNDKPKTQQDSDLDHSDCQKRQNGSISPSGSKDKFVSTADSIASFLCDSTGCRRALIVDALVHRFTTNRIAKVCRNAICSCNTLVVGASVRVACRCWCRRRGRGTWRWCGARRCTAPLARRGLTRGLI